MNYDEACQRATTAQGLDPVLKAFSDAGVEGVGLEQTGGFCMVVTVTRDDTVYGITCDDDRYPEKYQVGVYSQEGWTSGEDTGEDAAERPLTANEIVMMVGRK